MTQVERRAKSAVDLARLEGDRLVAAVRQRREVAAKNLTALHKNAEDVRLGGTHIRPPRHITRARSLIVAVFISFHLLYLLHASGALIEVCQ